MYARANGLGFAIATYPGLAISIFGSAPSSLFPLPLFIEGTRTCHRCTLFSVLLAVRSRSQLGKLLMVYMLSLRNRI